MSIPVKDLQENKNHLQVIQTPIIKAPQQQ
jgi:hypothetical protein